MTDQQFPQPSEPTAVFPTVVQQPAMQQPVVQQPPLGGAPTSGSRRRGLIGAGALVVAAGSIAGVVMLLASSSNYDEGVQNLARAPIGCTTSLEFDEAGSYLIYVETTGSVGEMRGDCPNADTDFDLGFDADADDLPDVEIVLVDDDGDEVDLDTDSSADYDAAGFVGWSVASVEIDRAGDFELTATSDEREIAISVGRNPQEAAGTMRTAGILALALGAAFGGLLIVLGLRPVAAKPAPPTGSSGQAQYPQAQYPQAQYPQAQYPQAQYPPAPAAGQSPAAPGGVFPPAAPGPLAPPPPPPAGPPPGSWPAPPST
jgi:hypothetical protein